jgi:hypothetical protein
MPDLYISLERRAGFDAALKGTAVKLLYLSASHHERSEGARLAAQLLDQEGGANALITASYVLLEAVFDVFFKRGGLSDNIRLATFGDHRLPNFSPAGELGATRLRLNCQANSELRLVSDEWRLRVRAAGGSAPSSYPSGPPAQWVDPTHLVYHLVPRPF